MRESYSKAALNNAVCTDEVKVYVMGMPWDTNSDVLRFKFENLVNNSEKKSVTKRVILSTAARFFYPLGLLSPITVTFKCLFQDLCRSGIDWDTLLEYDMIKSWYEIVDDMKDTAVIEVPRHILGKGNPDEIILH